MPFPELPDGIEVAGGIDLDDVWDRFEIFEALHHTMTIDNPMSSEDLDRVVVLLAPADGDRVLDLACGHGELLRRLRRAAPITGVGVDLSPWMLTTAHRLAQPNEADLSWVLDDAKHHGDTGQHDIVTCLGASWVWLGLPGTIRAIAQRAVPGGRVAIGDMHLRPSITPDAVTASHGSLDSIGSIEAMFARAGIELIETVNTADHSWDDYLARTRDAAELWAKQHPGEAAEEFRVEQRKWEQDHARDRAILTWSVWVGERRQ